MMLLKGKTIGILGALSAFPRRLAAREIERQGGRLSRSVTRLTTTVVFGRTLLGRLSTAELEARYAELMAQGKTPISEVELLRQLGLEAPQSLSVGGDVIRQRSGLNAVAFDMLSLFDAFEGAAGGPYSFADLSLAKKYEALLEEGADWRTIALSIHTSGDISSMARQSMRSMHGRVMSLQQGALAELDGQSLLPLNYPSDVEIDDLFSGAEELEEKGEYALAVAAYERCLAADPKDSIAAFNLANALKKLGDFAGASANYALAIKLDPRLSEAWFNFAGLLRDHGKIDGARHHLKQALKVEPKYADAIYNMAALEYDAGELIEARSWWKRYLKLDANSDWAKTATRGIQFVEIELAAKKAAHR